MITIPEACMAYTKVFQTLKIELVVMLAVGFIIGYIARRLEK